MALRYVSKLSGKMNASFGDTIQTMPETQEKTVSLTK
jgi:hypothetical protein